MAIKKIRLDKSAEAAQPKPENNETAQMPKFVFAADMGRRSLDEIETDLVLLTVLTGMEVPRDLHAKSSTVGDQIKSSINASSFEGRRGESLLIETECPGTTDGASLNVLVVGLGRPEKFCAGVAQGVFQQIINEAIRLKARRVTIPFAPNRGTSSNVNMKCMGFQLKQALSKCLQEHGADLALEEVQIYCTSQAKRHIEQGLNIPVKSKACPC